MFIFRSYILTAKNKQMRIELQLQTKAGSILPFNYEYAISSWIYKMLAQADPQFATWLHDKGYSLSDSGKKFKLFTFSPIQGEPYRIDRQKGFILPTGKAKLILSFLIDQAMQGFVMGIFQSQSLHIRTHKGNITFAIASVNILPTPNFQPIMRFRATKPIFLSKRMEGEKYAVHISPTDAAYADFFFTNLKSKALAINTDVPLTLTDFWATPQPKSKILRIAGTQIRAFQFDFIVAAPPELLRIGYFAGFGGKNSGLGLGYWQNEKKRKFYSKTTIHRIAIRWEIE